MIAAALRILQPFNRPRPVTLACDPVLSSLAQAEREARKRHQAVADIQAAKSDRLHQILRGEA
jgi:hypothetical protein